jgi:hypothetical protein
VGVLIVGRIGETPNMRGHSIVEYLEVTGLLFKLTATSTDNTVNQLRQQIGSIRSAWLGCVGWGQFEGVAVDWRMNVRRQFGGQWEDYTR